MRLYLSTPYLGAMLLSELVMNVIGIGRAWSGVKKLAWTAISGAVFSLAGYYAVLAVGG